MKREELQFELPGICLMAVIAMEENCGIVGNRLQSLFLNPVFSGLGPDLQLVI